MSLLRTAVKAGIAKKLFDMARKPQNQRKIKDAINQFTGKGGKNARRRR